MRETLLLSNWSVLLLIFSYCFPKNNTLMYCSLFFTLLSFLVYVLWVYPTDKSHIMRHIIPLVILIYLFHTRYFSRIVITKEALFAIIFIMCLQYYAQIWYLNNTNSYLYKASNGSSTLYNPKLKSFTLITFLVSILFVQYQNRE